MPIRLCGKTAAEHIYHNITTKINHLLKNNIVPGLTVIQVGDKKDSTTYVNMKAKMCEKYKINSNVIRLPDTIHESELIEIINTHNNDNSVHGILIQLPLPKHICEDNILNTVHINKDVDGFNIQNVGKLSINAKPKFVPCTPDGCIEMLKYYNIDVAGKHAVVIGRSRIVGLPLAHLLLRENATVSICHSKTQNIQSITKSADLIFAACGKANFIDNTMVKDNAIIIDIGINPVPDETKKTGYRLVGDVNYDDVKDKVHAISPVPGGVGPMTIAMLLKHTVDAAEQNSLF
jgi:5,10-methylene-tetrahydrofolate dehydrogenase/methenyl tetrahydrofolate cyclohydrolase